MGSKQIETDLGLIEYVIYGKEGPYVIALHGTPGGYDQILPYLSRVMSNYKCRIVAVSRPGYGNTQLTRNNGSFEKQADMIDSLMDKLKIDRAIIYGISGGGAVAIHFAAKYKSRCNGLILESSVGYRYVLDHRSLIEYVNNLSLYLEIGSKVNLFITKYFPRVAIKLLFNRVGNLSSLELSDAVDDIINNKIKLKIFRQLVESFSNPHLRLNGMRNDLHHLEHSANYPLSKINIPTLVIHGTRDSDASIEHADYIVKHIESSTLLEIYNGTHILPLSNRTWMISNTIIEFIEDHG